MEIRNRFADPIINLCLDTIDKNRQALVFCNTKRGAESQAEKIAKKTALTPEKKHLCNELAEKILKVLETPTKQCERLALCVRGGCSFHHAGLPSKQREIIEEAFCNNQLFVICSTPTLAMGLDMPAFRSIIRDVKRFNPGRGWGLSYIPVLEYHQMAGRAGRPGHETWGEAILIAQDQGHAQELTERYIYGEAEDIVSKLAVEPVLRTYLLSLIATSFIQDEESMYSFFEKTFYAHQYGDMKQLQGLLNKMLSYLEEWGFIKIEGKAQKEDLTDDLFSSADELITTSTSRKLRPTLLGVRVAELYLDPYTAQFLLKHLREHQKKQTDKIVLSDEGLLHLLTNTLEIRPLLTVRAKEYTLVDEWYLENEEKLLVSMPTQHSYDFDEYFASLKTTMLLLDWINEETEESLLEKYGVRPGELKGKTDTADWLLYGLDELVKLAGLREYSTFFTRMRTRIQYGVREELLPLMRFKGVGKVRARVLYRNNIRSVAAVKEADVSVLAQLIGPALTQKLKEQVGEKVEVTKPRKRKGQKSLGDWG